MPKNIVDKQEKERKKVRQMKAAKEYREKLYVREMK